MSAPNYKLPLNFDRFFDTGTFEKCTEQMSIDQHIELLLTTCPGEHKFNPDYGCKIWELDFDHNSSTNKWKKLFHDYVRDAVVTFEKRITNVDVNIVVEEIVRSEISDRTTIRKRVSIIVKSIILSTQTPCTFGYNIYLGPITNH